MDDPNYREPKREKSQRPRERDRGRFVRLHMNAGKDKGISQRHIVGTITDKAGVKSGSIGKIEIFPNGSFVEIKDRDVSRVLAAMQGQKVKGIPVRLEKAKPRRRK